jgi:hypothetical protein
MHTKKERLEIINTLCRYNIKCNQKMERIPPGRKIIGFNLFGQRETLAITLGFIPPM